MSEIGIYNAKIRSWEMELDEDYDNRVMLKMVITSTRGTARIDLPAEDIEEVFSVLEIKNLDELQGCSCIVLVEDRIFRTIGNFMSTYTLSIKKDWYNGEKYINKLRPLYISSGRVDNYIGDKDND